MKGLWAFVFTATVFVSACSGVTQSGRIYIEPKNLANVSEEANGQLLSNAGKWQTVKVGNYTFESKCQDSPSKSAKVSIPVAANDEWRVEFIPCGVRALKGDEIPEILRDRAT